MASTYDLKKKSIWKFGMSWLHGDLQWPKWVMMHIDKSDILQTHAIRDTNNPNEAFILTCVNFYQRGSH